MNVPFVTENYDVWMTKSGSETIITAEYDGSLLVTTVNNGVMTNDEYYPLDEPYEVKGIKFNYECVYNKVSENDSDAHDYNLYLHYGDSQIIVYYDPEPDRALALGKKLTKYLLVEPVNDFEY